MNTDWSRRIIRALGGRTLACGGHRIERRRGRVVAVAGAAGGMVYEVTDAPSALYAGYSGSIRDGSISHVSVEGSATSCKALLAMLEDRGSGRSDPDAAAAIRAMLGEEATRRADAALPNWYGPEIAALSGEAGARRMREILDAAPTRRLRGVGEMADPFGWATRHAGPGSPPPGKVRRLLATAEVPSVAAFALLLALPEDWTPRDPQGWGAVERLALALSLERHGTPAHLVSRSDLAVLLGSYDFLRGSRGRWAEYADRLGFRDRAGVDALRHHVSDALDMVRAFAREVVVPVLHRHGLCDDLYEPSGASPACAVAARVLLGGKGLPAILAASRDWHAGGFGATGAIAPGRGWPVPFARAVAPGGATLRALSTGADLAAEGAGLRHCVGGYGPRCAAGASVIVSVLDAAGARSSTLELTRPSAPGRPFGIAQHRGARNAEPPPTDAAAAAWLVSVLGTEAMPVDPAFLAHRWQPDTVGRPYDAMDDAALAAAVAAWSPFLPRPSRTPDGASAAIVEAVLDLARTRYPLRPDFAVGTDGGLSAERLDWHPAPPDGDIPMHRDPLGATVRRRLRGVLPVPGLDLAARLAPYASATAIMLVATVPPLALFGLPLPWALAISIVIGLSATLAMVFVPLTRPAARLRHRAWMRRAEAAARTLGRPGRDATPAGPRAAQDAAPAR